MNRMHRSCIVFGILLMPAALLLQGCGSKYSSNGEAIYMTGSTLKGVHIEADVDRSGLADPSMQLACVMCHGADRTGRKSGIPDFGPYNAPDITPASLSEEAMPVRPAYDRATLIRAIREGVYPSGKRLHHPMPRWKLSDADAADLAEWLLGK